MKKLTVYLAGAIKGLTDEEANSWRNEISLGLGNLDFNILNPMRRDYRGRESTYEAAHEIISLDKLDIDNSDFLVVYYKEPSVGTSMEVLYAWERNKPIVLISAVPFDDIPPWLIYHSTKIVYNQLDAIKWIKEYLVD